MKANWAILKTAIDEFSHYGDVGISVQSPTGEVWSRQGDIQFPAASIAKIPIMITVYRMIDQNRLALDNEYILQNIYPNPFTPNATISYSIPEYGLTSIEVYNIMGKKIESLRFLGMPGPLSITEILQTVLY